MPKNKGVLRRVYDSIFSKEKRFTYEEYVNFGMTNSLTGASSEGGEMVSVLRGTKVGVAFSCINALSQDIAKLPYAVRQETNNGRLTVKNSPVYRLIHSRPNSYTSAFNFWYQVVFSILSNGNAFALIKRKGTELEELIILPANDVEVQIIEGTLYYKYNETLFNQSDILHYKLYSFDGIMGVSPIIHNAEAFGYKIKQDKYKAKVLGVKPPGVLTFTQELTTDQMNQNKNSWKNMTQGINLGGTPVLSGGAKYQPFMIPPNEGQMVEAAELANEEIAGIYRVPPTLIQDYRRATFSNAEQQDLVYVKYGITPIIRMIEQENDYKLFKESNKTAKEPFYTKFNINGMLRGDTESQIELFRFMKTEGIMNADEIREVQDMTPIEGGMGKIYTIQGANVPLHQLEDFYKDKSGEEIEEEEPRKIGFSNKDKAELLKESILNKKRK